MVTSKISIPVAIAVFHTLVSCAAPKAVVVEAAPAPMEKKTEAPEVVEAPMPIDENDGLRGLDNSMLALPDESEFRATVPTLPATSSNANPVISRPPTDPPSRPKPKETE